MLLRRGNFFFFEKPEVVYLFEIKQKVYDIWLKNAINSTDGRNGRNMVQLSKRKYLEQYGSIKNKNIVIEEVKNK